MQNLYGQSCWLCYAWVWTYVYMHNLWQTNGRMSNLPTIRGQGSAHFQSLNYSMDRQNIAHGQKMIDWRSQVQLETTKDHYTLIFPSPSKINKKKSCSLCTQFYLVWGCSYAGMTSYYKIAFFISNFCKHFKKLRTFSPILSYSVLFLKKIDFVCCFFVKYRLCERRNSEIFSI